LLAAFTVARTLATFAGNTQAAVRRAAAAAGAGWPKLYSQLAFVPPRSDDYIYNDIDGKPAFGEP